MAEAFLNLQEARFLERRNRFLVAVDLGGRIALCHLPNPGRLEELLRPGVKAYLKRRGGPRKTEFDIVAVDFEGLSVSIDSRLPNRVVRRLLSEGRLREFQGYRTVIPEVRLGNSRVDFLLKNGKDCYLEVKSCTLVIDGVAMFPDAPTERGRRHLEELAGAAASGRRACALFVVQRPDATLFRPNVGSDILFASTLERVQKEGVEVYAYKSRFDGENLVDFERIQTSLVTS